MAGEEKSDSALGGVITYVWLRDQFNAVNRKLDLVLVNQNKILDALQPGQLKPETVAAFNALKKAVTIVDLKVPDRSPVPPVPPITGTPTT